MDSPDIAPPTCSLGHADGARWDSPGSLPHAVPPPLPIRITSAEPYPVSASLFPVITSTEVPLQKLKPRTEDP